MKFETETKNDNLAEIAGGTHNVVEKIVIQTVRLMQEHGDLSAPNHLYVCLSAAAAALEVAAKIMSVPEDLSKEELEGWSAEPATRTAILASALLLSRCVLPCNDGIVIEYSSLNIKATLDALTKITGNPDYSMLAPQLVKAADGQRSPDHFFDNTRGRVVETEGTNTIH
jgi:hypothetical protein